VQAQPAECGQAGAALSESGVAGLQDRSSRPQACPRRTPAELVERVGRTTVSRLLVRLKLDKAKMLEPQTPVVRYEHAAPGDMLHLDIAKELSWGTRIPETEIAEILLATAIHPSVQFFRPMVNGTYRYSLGDGRENGRD
jgi:leucine-zipper of insertion element IS481